MKKLSSFKNLETGKLSIEDMDRTKAGRGIGRLGGLLVVGALGVIGSAIGALSIAK